MILLPYILGPTWTFVNRWLWNHNWSTLFACPNGPSRTHLASNARISSWPWWSLCSLCTNATFTLWPWWSSWTRYSWRPSHTTTLSSFWSRDSWLSSVASWTLWSLMTRQSHETSFALHSWWPWWSLKSDISRFSWWSSNALPRLPWWSSQILHKLCKVIFQHSLTNSPDIPI